MWKIWLYQHTVKTGHKLMMYSSDILVPLKSRSGIISKTCDCSEKYQCTLKILLPNLTLWKSYVSTMSSLWVIHFFKCYCQSSQSLYFEKMGEE